MNIKVLKGIQKGLLICIIGYFVYCVLVVLRIVPIIPFITAFDIEGINYILNLILSFLIIEVPIILLSNYINKKDEKDEKITSIFRCNTQFPLNKEE